MKKTPPPISDPDTLAILHRVGANWRGLIASTRESHPTEKEYREFTADRVDRIDAWLEENRAGAVLCVLPACAVICRTHSLPDASPEQLDQALRLQAEAHLLGVTPPHRVAMAVLPAAPGETTRTGLVLAWPEAAEFKPPVSSRPVEFIPDVAAIAAILNGQRPAEPLLWLDRQDGSVAAVITHSSGALFRATREEPSSIEVWQQSVGRVVAESSLNVGHTGAFVEAIVQSARQKASTLRAGEAKLFMPREILAAVAARVHGAPGDESWWAVNGVAAGALLARTGALKPLTHMLQAPPMEAPSKIRSIAESLSRSRTAFMAATLCVLLLLFGPLAYQAMRLLILQVRFGDARQAWIEAKESKAKVAVYREFEKQKFWPMTKLLADITNYTPIGIELETIRIESGKDFALSGTAISTDGRTPAQLVAQFQENLARADLFSDIALNAGKSDNLGRYRFDLSAKIINPYKRPALADDLDFAVKTYRSRLYPDAEETQTASKGADGEGDAPAVTTTSTSGERTVRTTALAGDGNEGDTNARASLPPRTFDGGPIGEDPSLGGDIGRAPPSAPPPPLDVEQIKVMSKAELKDALAKIAKARNNRDLDKDVQSRLKKEQDLILEYLRKAPN